MSYITISEARFKLKPLRAHELLKDARLQEVWAFELPGGEDRDMRDVRAVFSRSTPTRANWKVRFLFRFRSAVGKIFRLDEPPKKPDIPYLEKLTDEDRSRSLETPGTSQKGFQTLYVFENEAADEISNRLVHAVSVVAIEPTGNGHTAYWAIYLRREVRGYMALINPFRHKYIYPAIIDRFQRKWVAEFPQSTRRVYGFEKPGRTSGRSQGDT